MAAEWDLVVVGGGIAGLTAGMWAHHLGLAVQILERERAGGQLRHFPEMAQEFPGLPGVQPGVLADIVEAQARRLAIGPVPGDVHRIVAAGDGAEVHLADGRTVVGRTVLVATGSVSRALGVVGEDLPGRVAEGLTVLVVGGGDAAAGTAAHLAEGGVRVVWVCRDAAPIARPDQAAAALSQDAVRLATGAVVTEIGGHGAVEWACLRYADGREERIAASAVLARAGRKPVWPPIAPAPATDRRGHLVTSDEVRTAIPAVLAAGDVVGPPRLFSALRAAAQGAAAARYALERRIGR